MVHDTSLVVVDADPARHAEWQDHSSRSGVSASIAADVREGAALLDGRHATTLIIRCRGLAADDVLALVAAARAAEEPRPVLLLSDDTCDYRALLRERGLAAEVLRDTSAVPLLLCRMGLTRSAVASDRRKR